MKWPFSRRPEKSAEPAKPDSLAKGFDVLNLEAARQRRASTIETKGEDAQLSPPQSHRLTNLHRDMMRNSPMRVMQDQQIRVNVVGAVGGKLYASFPEGFGSAQESVMRYFNRRWYSHAEFSHGQNFNWLLKTAITAQDVGGNVILVFDDGILTGGNGTGKIRGFEGDELANIPQNEFEKRFPKSYRQVKGLVYNESGIVCGAFVSSSQRGRSCFDPSLGFVTLRRDPYDDETTPNWTILGDMRRFNQGRAVSPVTAALMFLLDLHETVGSEANSAKLNSKLVYQLLKDAEADKTEPGGVMGAGFAPLGSGASTASGEGGESREVDVRPLKQMGAIGIDMPKGVKAELFDTKHPNPNMPSFNDFLLGVIGGVKGLMRVYATGKAQTSYTAFRGEQIMTWPSFEEMQKDLERLVCDWAARLVISRAVKLGKITEKLPDDWADMLAWQWPKMREVSEKEYQQALQLALQIGTTSRRRILGPGQDTAIHSERAREAAADRNAGLIYPGTTTASGQVAEDGAGGKDNRDETVKSIIGGEDAQE